jgi:hypothetical protein
MKTTLANSGKKKKVFNCLKTSSHVVLSDIKLITFLLNLLGAEGQTEWASKRRNDLNDFGTTAVVTVLRILNGKAVQMVVANSGRLHTNECNFLIITVIILVLIEHLN